MRGITMVLTGLALLGAVASASADEVKAPIGAALMLDLTAPRADSRAGAFDEALRDPGPPERAGIAVNAPFDSATVRGNRIWHRDEHTQTYGFWVTGAGSCVSCRVEDNDLAGNEAAVRLDTPPIGGRWDRNHCDGE